MTAAPAAETASPSQPRVPSLLLMRRVFLGALGLIYTIAFASLWWQLEGLLGSGGVLPAADYVEGVSRALGDQAPWRLPTLCWTACSDASLHVQAAAGLALGLLLAAGVAPPVTALGAWALYLSLASAGGLFFGYQWDSLLLETGLLAVFLAPRQLRPGDAWRSRVPRTPVWLLRLLLFRLLFGSGVVKLLSGDATWRSLTALEYHYFTQPLPAWTSWYAHFLPDLVHRLSALGMFAIELVLPFFVFGPRRARQVAAAGCLLLQILIGLTGNYGFFNLLTAALCLPLLDDRALRALLPAGLRARLPAADEAALPGPSRAGRAAMATLAVVLATFAGATLLEQLGGPLREPPAVARLRQRVAALRSFNRYGLFAVMTTERPEIVLEGRSGDGPWRPYALPYKPGRIDRAPRFAQPHMPRLDWQLWFAALRGCGGAPWLQHLVARLLEGRPEVTALLAEDPFAGAAPPDRIRAVLYRYRFAPPGSDAWWTRERIGLFCPTAFALSDGRLVPVRAD